MSQFGNLYRDVTPGQLELEELRERIDMEARHGLLDGGVMAAPGEWLAAGPPLAWSPSYYLARAA